MMASKPVASSTPLTFPSSWNDDDNYLSLEELLQHLNESESLRSAEAVVDGLQEDWTDQGLSGWACYEILYGALLDRTSGKNGALLEALCFFVEQTLNLPSSDIVKNGLTFFRTFIPALYHLLHIPDCSGWAARMLACVCLKEGVLADETVFELRRALKDSENLSVLAPSSPTIRGTLEALQPLRPDLITEDFSKEQNEEKLPVYSFVFQSKKAAQTTQDHSLSSLLTKKTFHTKYPTPLQRSHKSRPWFTGDALASPENFTALWTHMRFPDQLLCLLTDANYLTAYWLSARPSQSAITMERRLLDMIQDLLSNEVTEISSDGTDSSDEESEAPAENDHSRKVSVLLNVISSHIHETLPSVPSMALGVLQDPEASMDRFAEAIERISLIYLSGNEVGVLEQTFSVIADVFLEASDQDQTKILAALRVMLRDWQRDLPRLWELSKVKEEKENLAKQSFVHFETAIQAAYVDTVATFHKFGNLIDKILWKPVTLDLISENISLRYWDEILLIWKQIIEIGEMEDTSEGASTDTNVTVFIPHPQLMYIGSLQPIKLIEKGMDLLLDRCWRLPQPSSKNEQLRMDELYNLFGKKRSK